MKVKKINDKVSMSEKDGNLLIINYGKVVKWQETLLFIWVLSWTICGMVVLFQLFTDLSKEVKLALAIYLSFWVYYEFKIVYVYLWRAFGKELIKINETEVLIKNDIYSYGKAKRFLIDNIQSIKLNEIEETAFSKVMNQSFWKISHHAFCLDYFGKTIYFGKEIPKNEAVEILKKLQTKIRMKA
jgi:hypothetical protein